MGLMAAAVAAVSKGVQTCKELAQPIQQLLSSLSLPAATATTAAVNNSVVKGAIGVVQRSGVNGIKNTLNLGAATGDQARMFVMQKGGAGGGSGVMMLGGVMKQA